MLMTLPIVLMSRRLVSRYINVCTYVDSRNQLDQPSEIRRPQTGDRIPARGSIPASIGNNRTPIGIARKPLLAITAGTRAAHDVIQPLAAPVIQPGVQEAKDGLASAQPRIVEQTDDTGEGGGGARRAVELAQLALFIDGVVHALGGDVGESAAGGVEEALEAGAQVVMQEGADGIFLVLGAGEEVREAARGEEGSFFGVGVVGGANGGHVGAGARELGREVSLVPAVVGDASGADAGVARGEDHRHAAAAQLREQVADGAGVFLWDGLFVLAVGGRDDLRELVLVHLQHVLEELQVRLVAGGGGVGLVDVGDHGGAAGGAELGDRQWRAHAEEVLRVEVGFAAVAPAGLVVLAAVVPDHGQVLAHGVRRQLFLELGQVRVLRVLLQVAREADPAAAGRVRAVVADVVEELQARGGGGLVADGEVGRSGSARQRQVVNLQRLAAVRGAVGADLAESRRGLDHVDIGRDRVWDRVLEGAQTVRIRPHSVDVPQEVGLQEVVGVVDGGVETDPVRVLLNVVDSGVLEPVAHRADG